MSDFLDRAKDLANDLTGKARGVVSDHSDQIDDGIDKAAGFVDEKTKGKYTDRIGSVQARAHEVVGRIAGDQQGPGESGGADTGPTDSPG